VAQDRLAEAFRRVKEKGRPGLIPFVTVGYPTVEVMPDIIVAVEQAGATAMELGIPFSDPLADGPVIQEADLVALANKVNVATCLQVAADARKRGVTMPLIFMTYLNPILNYGTERFAKDAAAAGADGVIAVDAPPEESAALRRLLATRGLSLIPLLAPTSTDERIENACRGASGFVYCVSLTGVTGARDQAPAGVPELVARIRRHTKLPVAVGFGISRPEHVRAVTSVADAAVVGSAMVRTVGQAGAKNAASAAGAFVSELIGSKAAPSKGGRRS
jgi:tryptophan synthase alpha chain